jgi:ubiquinone/menaquinone biosynthesis C-methylase UbiE
MSTPAISIDFSAAVPGFYDEHLGPMFFEPYAIRMADKICMLPTDNILELACGTGTLTSLLLHWIEKKPNGVIIASDINPSMLAFAEKKLNHKNILWRKIDALEIPYRDESFGCITSQFGVMFFSDRVKAFKEVWRTLKPGGTFIFNCWDEILHNPIADIVNNALNHFFSGNAPAFYTIPFSYHDTNIIRNDLREAGFYDMHFRLENATGYCVSVENAVKGLIFGTPTITAIEALDPERLPLFLKYLEIEISKKFGNNNLAIPLQAHVVSCIKR